MNMQTAVCVFSCLWASLPLTLGLRKIKRPCPGEFTESLLVKSKGRALGLRGLELGHQIYGLLKGKVIGPVGFVKLGWENEDCDDPTVMGL